jgi:hypothetical protein
MSDTCIFQWQIYVKWVPLILYFNDRFMLNEYHCCIFQWKIYVKWVPLILYFNDRLMLNECHLFYISVTNLCSMNVTYFIFQWQIYVKWVPHILYFSDRFMLNECHLFLVLYGLYSGFIFLIFYYVQQNNYLQFNVLQVRVLCTTKQLPTI